MALTLVMAGEGRAQLLEDHLQHATDGAATHLFTINPAAQKLETTSAAILVLRHQKEATLDQSFSGDDTVTTKTKDDFVAAGALLDLGAGAALGLSHQLLFHETETDVTALGNRDPVLETQKIQHSQLKLLVELTSELRAGMAVRYLYKDEALYGDPFLAGGRGTSEATRFRTTLLGYAAGLTYSTKTFGIGYAYYPPLRGKTEVEGEEKIVVERGQIDADAFYVVNRIYTAGLLYKRWINEVDDLATGTTAADDTTRISLYGLDLDQYLVARQMIMVSGDAAVNNQTTARLALGRETAEFNFQDFMQYNRVNVRQRADDAHAPVTYYRLRAAVKFTNQGVEIDAGAGYFTRKHEFSARENGAKYEATGKEIFATVSMKL